MTCREYQLYNQHLDNHADSEPAAEWDCLTFQSLLGYNITDISCYKENYGKLVEDRSTFTDDGCVNGDVSLCSDCSRHRWRG